LGVEVRVSEIVPINIGTAVIDRPPLFVEQQANDDGSFTVFWLTDRGVNVTAGTLDWAMKLAESLILNTMARRIIEEDSDPGGSGPRGGEVPLGSEKDNEPTKH
jgi:hypothetical protein